MSKFDMFCTHCISCNGTTSKSYARTHDGKCKTCVTGIVTKPKSDMLCPDCGINYLTPYQKARHYHCDACTREADPQGYYNEVMGYSEPSMD